MGDTHTNYQFLQPKGSSVHSVYRFRSFDSTSSVWKTSRFLENFTWFLNLLFGRKISFVFHAHPPPPAFFFLLPFPPSSSLPPCRPLKCEIEFSEVKDPNLSGALTRAHDDDAESLSSSTGQSFAEPFPLISYFPSFYLSAHLGIVRRP